VIKIFYRVVAFTRVSARSVPSLCSDYSSTDRKTVVGGSPARQIIREEKSEYHTSGTSGRADVSQRPVKREPNTSN
jgi:hypothetical protein